MYSYAILVGISIVISLGYSEVYVNCYHCSSDNDPGSTAKVDCFRPAMTNVSKCVGETCKLEITSCTGTSQECQTIGFSQNATAYADRYCTNNTIDADNCAVSKFSLYTETTCLCKGELCNAGPSVKVFPKITLVFLIMSSYVGTLLLQ